MKGSDIRCPACGTGTNSVAPDYDLDASFVDALCAPAQEWVQVTCTAGHIFCLHAQRPERGQPVEWRALPEVYGG